MFINEMTSPAAGNDDVLALLRSEREKSVSVREWKHRLVGYGYAVKNTDHGDVLAKFGSQEEICEIPVELLH
ncbi:hypothetical protein TG4357_01439 [Thalassovita gelatinovora]|uniref:Uncharacterized protein n=1 Tax=Thalassovita gelatinovora TaxID=53501 RepID=A0A0P1F9E3_THAGE|nr:hypothetical protein [Thalassovita gelatinovora]CUH64696.1 hypothetical protein TG4357_01439 [Thalassovita gelatinovora]SEP93523.1 hypothetical protein SAMN04488043_102236 [Thalassovita gelatinovora]